MLLHALLFIMIKLESNIYAVEISCDVQIANKTNYDIENAIAITIVYYFAIHYELLYCYCVMCIDIYKPYNKILH